MSVISEKAAKGNSKALENIYLNCRGLVGWIWSLLSGEKIDASEEKKIWKAFFDAVGRGKLAEGDSVERFLIAAATAVFCGNDPDAASKSSGEALVSGIKYPGDMDAGRKNMERLFSSLESGVRAAAMMISCGMSAKETGKILGVSADKASDAVASAAEALKNSAKELAGGRYNINIPAPEMFGDLLGRASVAIKADGDPDEEIIGFARNAGAETVKVQKDRRKVKEDGGSRKKSVWILAAILCCAAIAVFSGIYLLNKGKDPGNTPSGGVGTYDGPVTDDNGQDEEIIPNYTAVIEVEGYGTIELYLDSTAAPRTVKNFVDLVKSGFYDGLTFHRIMEGFMIQGGDPDGNGSGGSKKKILGEFSANGVENPISHKRGTISMARSNGDYNSARSQFFIVQKDSTYLDGQYAAFGYVTSGMEVVDKIAADANPIDDNGTIPAAEQPVIKSITVEIADE